MFGSICESATTEEDDGYRALTAMGLLNTIQTLVKAAVDNQVVRRSSNGSIYVHICRRNPYFIIDQLCSNSIF